MRELCGKWFKNERKNSLKIDVTGVSVDLEGHSPRSRSRINSDSRNSP